MKILVAVDSSNEAHEIAVVAKALFPSADHLIVSAVSPASYMPLHTSQNCGLM